VSGIHIACLGRTGVEAMCKEAGTDLLREIEVKFGVVITDADVVHCV